MANYYTKFSATFAVPPGAVAFAKAVQAANDGCYFDEHVEGADFTVEDVEALAREAEDWFEDVCLRVEGLDGDTRLWIRNDVNDGAPDYAAWLLQRIQERFEIDETWSFEYANVSDKSVPDGFGGGAVAIHRTGYEVEDSSTRRRELEKLVTPAASGDDPAP